MKARAFYGIKVYFADLRADVHENLQQKLTRLMKTAGMGDIDFQDKFVAIKLHFGEPGNLAFLRPNWARTVAGFCEGKGAVSRSSPTATLFFCGRAQERPGSHGQRHAQRFSTP